MTPAEMRKYCSAFPANDGNKDSDNYGTIWDWKQGFAYLTFTPKLLKKIQTIEERAKLPTGYKFIRRKIGPKIHLVLCLPLALSFKFRWQLNRRLSARENGFASSKRRHKTLAQQSHYHTEKDLRVIWKLQDGRCYYSGEILGSKFETSIFHTDHITPLSKGGHDGPINLALVTPLMNSQKRNKAHSSFMKWLKPSNAQLELIKSIDQKRRVYFREIDRLKQNRKK